MIARIWHGEVAPEGATVAQREQGEDRSVLAGPEPGQERAVQPDLEGAEQVNLQRC